MPIRKLKFIRKYSDDGVKGIWSDYDMHMDSVILYRNIKIFAHDIVKECWKPLENISQIKSSTIEQLKVENIPEEERKTDEITLLGELASYKRSVIKSLGIRDNQMTVLDYSLWNKGLDWEVSMSAIRELAGDK